jgi:hypothetical protein
VIPYDEATEKKSVEIYMRSNVVYSGRRKPDGSVQVRGNDSWDLNENYTRSVMNESPYQTFEYGESCRGAWMLGAAIIYDFLCDEQKARDYGKRFFDYAMPWERTEPWTLAGGQVKQALIELGAISQDA